MYAMPRHVNGLASAATYFGMFQHTPIYILAAKFLEHLGAFCSVANAVTGNRTLSPALAFQQLKCSGRTKIRTWDLIVISDAL